MIVVHPEVGQSLAYAAILYFSWTVLTMVVWKCYNWFNWSVGLFSLICGSAIAYLI